MYEFFTTNDDTHPFAGFCHAQITRSISAHEQHPVGPWLRTFPKKVIDRAPTYIIWLGGSLSLAYVSIATAQALTDAEDRSHRP